MPSARRELASFRGLHSNQLVKVRLTAAATGFRVFDAQQIQIQAIAALRVGVLCRGDVLTRKRLTVEGRCGCSPNFPGVTAFTATSALSSTAVGNLTAVAVHHFGSNTCPPR